ncbi:MAG: hypothetical protein HOV97_05860 [Nonomuraea sp.]|nr:hypothetical protein [Nonomuraea sp.]
MTHDSHSDLPGAEFIGIFDEISPDMFIVETSAIDEIEGNFRGATAFNASVDERLRGIKAAFASSFGKINPIAILTNATTQRVFVPQQDENLGQFLERMQREARTMGAHWFFFAKKNTFAVYYPEDDDEEIYDVGSDAARERAARSGSDLSVGILWYAERREGEEVHHRHGALEVEGHKVTKATEGDGDQTLGVFSTVLDAVRR